jgi:hypothetical protein
MARRTVAVCLCFGVLARGIQARDPVHRPEMPKDAGDSSCLGDVACPVERGLARVIAKSDLDRRKAPKHADPAA